MSDEPESTALPRLVSEELEEHLARLAFWQGRDLVGLATGTLARLDKATLGLRGLIFLAGAPNEGKTALALQLGLDVVRANPDVCFLFLSLEMARADMVNRLVCNLARLDWKDLVLGRPGGLGAEQTKDLELARTTLADIGQRMLILDAENFGHPNVEKTLAALARLKERSGCQRALILVDYLQVWPLPSAQDPIWGADHDSDPDMWRVGAMKALRDGSGDAVLAISEVRRPAEGQAWASGLADVAGSSRAIYTPDIVLMLQTLPEEEALRLIGGNPQAARQQMRSLGLAFNRLVIAKGRDGVVRDTLNLTFFHRQSRFADGFKVFSV